MKRSILAALFAVLISSTAYATQQTITQEGTFDYTVRKQINDNFSELYATVGGAPFSITATNGTFSGTFNADGATTFGDTVGITGATTAAAITGSGTLTLDDNSGASPSFVMQDQTNEAATFSKVDAGFLTITTVAGDGVQVTTGNLKVGNGTPGVTQDGEDAYVEGTLEVDGAATLDGALAIAGAVTLDDGSGASPSITLTDETDETAVLSKADAGNLSVTTTAGDGLQVLTGNLFIGNGTPGETINGEDLYVEGISEFDGTANFDGAVDIALGLTANGDITGDGGDQLTGFLKTQVASASATLTAAQCGSTIVSNSADTEVLPEASTVLGCRYTFVCGTADDFAINPADGTDTIGTVASITGTNTTTVLAPSAGDSITCTDIGSSIVLEAVGADLWASIGNANGIWTDTN